MCMKPRSWRPSTPSLSVSSSSLCASVCCLSLWSATSWSISTSVCAPATTHAGATGGPATTSETGGSAAKEHTTNRSRSQFPFCWKDIIRSGNTAWKRERETERERERLLHMRLNIYSRKVIWGCLNLQDMIYHTLWNVCGYLLCKSDRMWSIIPCENTDVVKFKTSNKYVFFTVVTSLLVHWYDGNLLFLLTGSRLHCSGRAVCGQLLLRWPAAYVGYQHRGVPFNNAATQVLGI